MHGYVDKGTEVLFFGSVYWIEVVLFFMIGAFGESLSFAAQKKVTKEKGRQTPSLRGFCQASAQQS
jgi:hypothetical protein